MSDIIYFILRKKACPWHKSSLPVKQNGKKIITLLNDHSLISEGGCLDNAQSNDNCKNASNFRPISRIISIRTSFSTAATGNCKGTVAMSTISCYRAVMNEKFDVLPLKQELLHNLKELNFSSMTPIQAQSLPEVLSGKDVIAQAKTGSGKTAAYGLGLLNSLDVDSLNIQSFVLCPTRELAEQVAQEIRTLARTLKNVKVLTLCGGVAEFHQERSLSYGAHIIVATPGRVLKLLKNNLIVVKDIKTFVLDEADRLLDMGFHDDLMEIIGHLPAKKQTLLFSATFPKTILTLSKDIQYNATLIKVDVDHDELCIEEFFYKVKSHPDKEATLLAIMGNYKPKNTIIFCKTKQIANSVTSFLNANGVVAEAIHSDLDQNKRTAVLTKFSNQSISALVATDVAARGLDIEDLEAVINFDLPRDPEIYIHRIGRTGRAGKNGRAFNLIVPAELYQIEELEKLTHKKYNIEDSMKLTPVQHVDLIPPMKTMYVSGGKKDKLRPGDILGALVGEAKLSSEDVGDITIMNIVSYVAIKRDCINNAISKLNAGKIKNRKFKVGIA